MIRLTREDLYQMVWELPMVEIAKRYIISDVGFRKICLKLNIPFPKVGDWAKIRAGHLIEKPELSTIHHGKDHVELEERPPERPVKQLSELDILIKQISRERLPIKVPERLTRPDPLITAAKESLAKLTDVNHPGMAVTAKWQLDIRVTLANVGRALRFMDTFIKCVRARGHRFEVNNDGNFVVIRTIRLRVKFRERTTRTRVHGKAFHDHEWRPTGDVMFRLNGRQRAEWQDLKTQLLEDQLPKVLAKLELAAKQEEVYLANAQVWQDNWERERREKAEWDAKQRKELAALRELVDRAKQWKMAQLLREYVDSIPNADEEWINWAKHKADWLDPHIMLEDQWLRDVSKDSLS